MIPSYIVMPQLLGVKGIWLALGVSEFLTSLCIAVYYFRHREKELKACMLHSYAK